MSEMVINIISGIAYLILAPVIGGLLAGVDRKISARMQLLRDRLSALCGDQRPVLLHAWRYSAGGVHAYHGQRLLYCRCVFFQLSLQPDRRGTGTGADHVIRAHAASDGVGILPELRHIQYR